MLSLKLKPPRKYLVLVNKSYNVMCSPKSNDSQTLEHSKSQVKEMATYLVTLIKHEEA